MHEEMPVYCCHYMGIIEKYCEEEEANMSETLLTKSYQGLLKEIKEKVRASQIKAAVAVNQELIKLYWEIGNSVQKKQQEEGWGAKTIEKLAKDLKAAFPDMKGFSLRNIHYMVKFAREYPDISIVQQLVAQIPWGHDVLLRMSA